MFSPNAHLVQEPPEYSRGISMCTLSLCHTGDSSFFEQSSILKMKDRLLSDTHVRIKLDNLNSAHITHHNKRSLVGGVQAVYIIGESHFGRTGNVDNVPAPCSCAILVDEDENDYPTKELQIQRLQDVMKSDPPS